MTNSELWSQYSNYSKDLSDNIRKLAFASAAISWFFRDGDNIFPHEIKLSLGFVVVFFIFDIGQYFSGAVSIKIWTEKEEKKLQDNTGSIEGNYDKPKWLDYPPFYCWVTKILALILSYAILGAYIFTR